MLKKIIDNWIFLVVLTIIGVLFYGVYENITLGKHRCEEKCLAEGAIDSVWAPGYSSRRGVNKEAECTCITGKEKEEFKRMMENLKKAKEKRENRGKKLE